MTVKNTTRNPHNITIKKDSYTYPFRMKKDEFEHIANQLTAVQYDACFKKVKQKIYALTDAEISIAVSVIKGTAKTGETYMKLTEELEGAESPKEFVRAHLSVIPSKLAKRIDIAEDSSEDATRFILLAMGEEILKRASLKRLVRKK